MGKCLFMRKGEVHTAPSAGILASDFAVGSTVKLMENGVAVDYLVVNQGIPSGSSLYDSSCDGTWLLRKDLYEKRAMEQNHNYYANSAIHTYLNDTFIGLFDSDVQTTIKQVKIPHHNGKGTEGSIASGSNGLSTKVFLLGGYEVGWTTNNNYYYPVDGACLSYFSSLSDTDSKRIGCYEGASGEWWLRSAHKNGTYAFFTVDRNGGRSAGSGGSTYYIRPALIVPFAALFDKNTLILKGVS